MNNIEIDTASNVQNTDQSTEVVEEVQTSLDTSDSEVKQRKVNISAEDLKRYNHHAAKVSRISILAPIDLVFCFLKELNRGIDVSHLYLSAIVACLIETIISFIFRVPHVGLYYCIGTSLLCIFIYITNPTEHYIKTWQSAKLYFNAGILLDNINQLGIKMKNVYNSLKGRYLNVDMQDEVDDTSTKDT